MDSFPGKVNAVFQIYTYLQSNYRMKFKFNILDLIATISLLAVSGFPYFIGFHKTFYPLILVILFAIALTKQSFFQTSLTFFLISTSIIMILFLVQGFYFSFVNFNLVTEFFLYMIRVIIGFLALVILNKNNFWRYFIGMMTFFSVVSLVFYGMLLVVPDLEGILIDVGRAFEPSVKEHIKYEPSILIFSLNIHDESFAFIRNPGPFWEPGTYAGFLNMAIVVNLIMGKKLFSRVNLLFMVALITTFSTGGYLTLMFVMFYFAFFGKRFNVNPIKVIAAVVVLAGSIWLFFEIPFLKHKIDNQFLAAEEGNMGRIGSAVVDMKDIQKYPLLGRSKIYQLRFDNPTSYFTLENHRVCGITDFMVQFGVPFSLFLYFFIFLGFKRFSRQYIHNTNSLSILLFITFLLFAFYEPIMTLPITYFLFFQHINLPRLKKVEPYPEAVPWIQPEEDTAGDAGEIFIPRGLTR